MMSVLEHNKKFNLWTYKVKNWSVFGTNEIITGFLKQSIDCGKGHSTLYK